MLNMNKPEGVSLSKETPEDEIDAVKAKPVAGLVAFGLLVLGAILVILFLLVSNNDKQEIKPEFGDPVIAQEKCEGFIASELGNPDLIAFSNQQAIQDTRFPTHYQVVGFAELENASGETVGKSFKCDLNYNPETKEWSSETSVNKG